MRSADVTKPVGLPFASTGNGAARETLSRLLDSLNVELSQGLSS